VEISVSDPLSEGMTRTGRMLFKPFNFAKWCTIGFAAFLSMLGEGGGGNVPTNFGGGGGGAPPAPRGPGGRGSPAPPNVLDEAWQFFLQHAWWIVPVFFVALLLWVGIVWLRARGKFIFVDCVARNHAAIVEPWKRLASVANSFFRFDLLVSVLWMALLLATAAVALTIAMPDIRARTFGTPAITAIVLGGLIVLALTICYLFIAAIAESFLIPLMYAQSQPVGPAWQMFRTRILPGHVGIIFVYFLLRGVLNVAAGMAIGFATCLTCLIAAIPYVGTVMFLPVFVFMRAYSLHFLAQFGPEYNVLAEVAAPPLAAFPVVFPQPLPPPPLAPPPLPPQQEA